MLPDLLGLTASHNLHHSADILPLPLPPLFYFGRAEGRVAIVSGEHTIQDQLQMLLDCAKNAHFATSGGASVQCHRNFENPIAQVGCIHQNLYC